METIHLLQFNNYFNRKIKRFTSIEDYEDYELVYYTANFIPGDDVNTDIIINYSGSANPNYILVEYDDGSFTRWFILDFQRTRAGQFHMNLRRDLVAEAYEDLLNAPMFIQKATCPSSNPFIYNKEGNNYNQIKKSETLIKENSFAWIIGYLTKLNDSDDKTVTGNFLSIDYDLTVSGITNWEYYQYDSTPMVFSNDQILYLSYKYIDDNLGARYLVRVGTDGTIQTISDSMSFDEMSSHSYSTADPNFPNSSLITSLRTSLRNNKTNLNSALGISSDHNTLSFLQNKIIYDSLNRRYYKIGVNVVSEIESKTIDSNFGSVFTNLKSTYDSYNDLSGSATSGKDDFEVKYTKNSVTLTITHISTQSATFSFDWDKQLVSKDGPYTTFAIPYPLNEGEQTIGYKYADNTAFTIQPSQEMALAIAQAISATFKGAGALVDLQLLPYLPMTGDLGFGIQYLNSGRYLQLSHISSDYLIEVKDNEYSYWYPILICPYTSFRRTIDIDLVSSEDYSELDETEIKIKNETELYRLVSPNYSNFEDFNPFMNKGVDNIDIECTYKPYNPYLHLSINYKGLYGTDFNDARGLICGGDFSLPQVTDYWQTYQIQNKNYSAVFDRQQQHLLTTQYWNFANSITNSVTSLLTGAASGAATGNIPGTLIGAAGGLVKGAMGIGSTIELNKEDVAYQKDLYNYNLGNIQAMPEGLAKNSGFNYNSKIIPFIETYSATDEEIAALRNKLKYNGMTINAMGTLNDYLVGEEFFFKAKLIRFPDSYENHFVVALNQELETGIYLGGE